MRVTTDMFFGEVLLGAEMITNEQLELAMRIHHHEGLKVGEALVKIGALTEAAVQEGLAVMTERRIRHLPVVDGDTVVGVVSIGDLVKAVIAEEQFVIEQLERYIAS